MELYPYQTQAVSELSETFRAHRRVVLQMPTGSGKTTVASEIIRRTLARGKRAVFSAHLDTLIGDTVRRLAAEGISAGRIQAGHPTTDSPVQVCSLQTLHARRVTPPGDLVIIDEAHRALAPTVKRIAESYPEGWVLGLTATPVRGDEQGLGDVFTSMVRGPSVAHLTSIGRLVQVDVMAPARYQRELAESPIDAAIRYRDAGHHVVVFAASVAESERIASASGGVHIDGTMDADARHEALARFASGAVGVISSCMVLTEGWDCPIADVCIIARGCGHIGAYFQMIGRVMRTAPGKERAIVADLRGSVHLYGLPTDDIQWTLDGVVRQPKAQREPIKRCSECGAVFRPRPVCPRCGHRFQAADHVVRRAPVERVQARVSGGERARLVELLATARSRGYKPAWAGVKFKEQFGFWPPWRLV